MKEKREQDEIQNEWEPVERNDNEEGETDVTEKTVAEGETSSDGQELPEETNLQAGEKESKSPVKSETNAGGAQKSLKEMLEEAETRGYLRGRNEKIESVMQSAEDKDDVEIPILKTCRHHWWE